LCRTSARPSGTAGPTNAAGPPRAMGGPAAFSAYRPGTGSEGLTRPVLLDGQGGGDRGDAADRAVHGHRGGGGHLLRGDAGRRLGRDGLGRGRRGAGRHADGAAAVRPAHRGADDATAAAAARAAAAAPTAARAAAAAGLLTALVLRLPGP